MSLFQSSEFPVGWVRADEQMTDSRGRGSGGSVSRIFRRADSCSITAFSSSELHPWKEWRARAHTHTTIPVLLLLTLWVWKSTIHAHHTSRPQGCPRPSALTIQCSLPSYTRFCFTSSFPPADAIPTLFFFTSCITSFKACPHAGLPLP